MRGAETGLCEVELEASDLDEKATRFVPHPAIGR